MNGENREEKMRSRRVIKKLKIVGSTILALFFVYYCYPYLTVLWPDYWKAYPREWVNVKNVPIDYVGSFTLMSYNILEDDLDGMRRPGHVRYRVCPKDTYNHQHRNERVVKEIKTRNPGVICMQEVGQKKYDTLLKPELRNQGYEGTIGVDEEALEGVKVGQAVFWKQDDFKLEKAEPFMFHDLIRRHISKTSLSNEEKELFYKWAKRRSMMVLVHLHHKTSGNKLIIGCVHFIAEQYHLPSLQVLQAAVTLEVMQDLSEKTGTKAFILAGDQNNPPGWPPYQYIPTGHLTEEIQKQILKRTGKKKLTELQQTFATRVLDDLPEAFMHRELNMISTYYTALGHEPVTTVHGTAGCLDYIWISQTSLGVSGVLAIPDNYYILKERLPEGCGLFPSDHIPIQARLYFK